MPTSTGYSGKPLAAKLGFKSGMHVAVLFQPPKYHALLGPDAPALSFQRKVDHNTNLVHMFCTERARLETLLSATRQAMTVETAIWVSWPKKSSTVATDITEDTIRRIALPQGLLDIKVCAVSEVWSGLKLVVRKALR